MKQLRSIACTAPLVFLGCGGASPAPAPPAAPPAAPPPAATSAAATPSRAEVAPPPAEPKKEEPTFFAVAEVAPDSQLYAPMGAVLVSTVLPDQTDRSFGVFEGDKLTFPERLKLTGAGTFNTVLDVRGKWPDAVDLFMTGSSGRIGRAEHWTLGPKGWKSGVAKESALFVGATEVGDSTLAVLAPAMAYLQMPTEWRVLRGKARAPKQRPVDRRACADVLKLTGDDRKDYLKLGAEADVAPRGLGATRAGTAFVVGTTCRGSAFETWRAGEAASTITELPPDAAGGDGFTPLAAGKDDEAWAFLDALYHYDGKAWTKVPDAPKLVTGAAQKDGTLWALGQDGKLYKGGVAGFSQVPVAGVKTIEQLVVAHDDSVWILAGNAVMRTRRPTDGAPAVVVKDAPKPPPRPAPLVPGSARCAKNMVLLYGFTKVTPDDFDFPKTREAVTGHTELSGARFVVTKENNKKYFTALVTSYAEGERLARLVESKVQGSKPAVLCVDRAPPEIVRELKIDLKTGKVVPLRSER